MLKVGRDCLPCDHMFMVGRDLFLLVSICRSEW
jgi:hypothetical protein